VTFHERCGSVYRDSWAGRRIDHVRIIGETPKRYRVRYPDGEEKLVPKTATHALLPGECLQHDVTQNRCGWCDVADPIVGECPRHPRTGNEESPNAGSTTPEGG